MSFPAQGQVCEGLADGGFEGGRPNTSWSETSSGVPVISGSSWYAHSGSWFAWFGGQLFEPLTQSLEQTVTIPSGRAELSYYLKIPEASTDEADFLSVSIDETALALYSIDDFTAFSSYQQVIHNLAGFADGASHTIRFEGFVSGAPVSSFRVDDVSLNLCPIPKREELFLYANRWRETGYGIEELLELVGELNEVKNAGRR